MPSRVDLARQLVTSKDTALSTVRLQPSSFLRPGSYSNTRTNARERRMTVTFGAVNTPTLVYHGLGFVPSAYTVLSVGAAAQIYNDFPLPASSRTIVLKCDTANTVADILIR
jgi:hypothetical protein